jgi:predicted transcriptional regulator
MAINQSLRNVLEIIADLSHNDVNTNIFDTTVVEYSNLPSAVVNNYLIELSSLGLIKMLKGTDDDAENNKNQYYRILNITRKGLRELSENTP